MPVIKGLILEQQQFTRTAGNAYDDLVRNGYERYKVFHSKNEVSAGQEPRQRNRELPELR